ncbi:WD40 repeat-like protein [Delitschia confertaspora ATCC 74209]|uniref:WD40 repeat-like protein n=1 Tax=Delitschia confertaspora ATCC 74209 TaxID=1513339 RepID=A0A9P4MPD4_9PLEO|nr:WD40 repeat-like protein [Delitschia confertaspora ATCC 74209]
MNDYFNYGPSKFRLGLVTPPSSPTRRTRDWHSPETPASPRKLRPCGLTCGGKSGLSLLLTPPSSPVKPRFKSSVASPAYPDSPPYDLNQICNMTYQQARSFSLPDNIHWLDGTIDSRSDGPSRSQRASVVEDDSRLELSGPASSPSLNGDSVNSDSEPVSLPEVDLDQPSISPSDLEENETCGERSYTALSPFSLRQSSSPLRSSQWVARGGILSLPRTPAMTHDRFIPQRRPPNITRESFEVNKPTDRLTPTPGTPPGRPNSSDPFSRRLRRSVRLNEELRSLRETNFVISGRAVANRRRANLSLRNGAFPGYHRQVSIGGVWNVGGASPASDTVVGVPTGRGGMLGSGTNAPLYTSMFLSRSDPEAELETYERRLALAFDVDQSDKVLGNTNPPLNSSTASSVRSSPANNASKERRSKHVWRDGAWVKDGSPSRLFMLIDCVYFSELTTVVLDAPQLRDDYYCSLLAYSPTAKCLAVGLGNFVHLWSERKGVNTPESLNTLSTTTTHNLAQHVTSLDFSSAQGQQAILAVGRANGRIALWSPFDEEPRFDATQPKPISYVSFRPTVVKRPSIRDRALMVNTEELLIGDEAGHIYFYSVEWPNEADSALFGWHGAMTLLARITMHTQQVCGLSWSSDGELFASGGNDNICFLYETKKILQTHTANGIATSLDVRYGPTGDSVLTVAPGRGPILSIEAGREKHKWELNAAVKAIAFCPWQRGLLAIGGGSNDRCIHFYHTVSGACLATIDCAAQVTSLIWSTSRKEIAATFGFAQPEHPFRIAVFAWPSCEQIVAIPWYDENRALFAIPYPGGPNMGRENGEDGVWWNRTSEEGCIVVAASDAAIRFHEIWTEDKRYPTPGSGLLGGSDILENLHGIEQEGYPTIR